MALAPADYWFHEGEVQYQAGRTRLFQPSVTGTVGQFYDGHRISIAPSAVWNAWPPHLELGADYSFKRMSLSTFWQYNSVKDVASLNARLRYNVRDGTDLWVVYNEALNTDRYTPVPPVSQGRALMVKYTQTLVW